MKYVKQIWLVIAVATLLFIPTPAVAQDTDLYPGDVLGGETGVPLGEYLIGSGGRYIYTVDFDEPTTFIIRRSNCDILQELVITTTGPFSSSIEVIELDEEDLSFDLQTEQEVQGICEIDIENQTNLGDIVFKSRVENEWLEDNDFSDEEVSLFIVDESNEALDQLQTDRFNRSSSFTYYTSETDEDGIFLFAEVLPEDQATNNIFESANWPLIAIIACVVGLVLLAVILFLILRNREDQQVDPYSQNPEYQQQ